MWIVSLIANILSWEEKLKNSRYVVAIQSGCDTNLSSLCIFHSEEYFSPRVEQALQDSLNNSHYCTFIEWWQKFHFNFWICIIHKATRSCTVVILQSNLHVQEKFSPNSCQAWDLLTSGHAHIRATDSWLCTHEKLHLKIYTYLKQKTQHSFKQPIRAMRNFIKFVWEKKMLHKNLTHLVLFVPFTEFCSNLFRRFG